LIRIAFNKFEDSEVIVHLHGSNDVLNLNTDDILCQINDATFFYDRQTSQAGGSSSSCTTIDLKTEVTRVYNWVLQGRNEDIHMACKLWRVES
jgi:hypothetical protein